MVTVNTVTSPSRSVKTYEQLAQLNAMKRALATAKQSAGEEAYSEVKALENMIQAIEAGRHVKDESYNKLCQKWAAREQQLVNRDAELLELLNADDKKRTDLLREVRRGKMEVISERGEKLEKRTQESDQRMRERDTERTKKLLEVSRQRFKRLERIAQQKQSRIQEHLKHREEEHHIRETKMSAIGRRQEEREARLEAELAEKERVVEERREKATRTRIERAGQTDKQRKEVCQRGMKNLDVDRLQHELAGKLELREKRVARFRAEQMDVLRDRMKTYDEKNEKKEQKLQLKSDNMIRGIQVNEKRRVEAEKRVTRNLAKMQQSHEEKVRDRDMRRVQMQETAREKRQTQEDEKQKRLLMKNVEAADRILSKLEDMNFSPKSLRLPLINGMTQSAAT